MGAGFETFRTEMSKAADLLSTRAAAVLPSNRLIVT